MNRVWVLLAILSVSLAPVSHAFGDGKVFATEATAEVDIPDQEALIHWADGVETLVIRTSFTGEGDEFAWVVPTPTEPEVTASTTGLFPTLRTLTAPTLRHPRYEFYLLAWLVALIVLGCSKGRFLHVLLTFLVVVLLLGILLPSLGAARGTTAIAGLEVHQRGVIGDYEVAVLSADDPAAVTAWLGDNGFKVSAQTDEVIRQYIDEGWFMTATRLTPEATLNGKTSTHPLAFRFPAERPIYPLRLTAVGSDLLEVDLYIFGPQRASADGFKTEYCNRLAYPLFDTDRDWDTLPDSSETGIRHPELLRIVNPAGFVTKLTASLSPADMLQDAVIHRGGDAIYIPVRWTYAGARNIAVNIGWTCLAFTVMALPFVFRQGAWLKEDMGKALLYVIVGVFVSGVLAATVYLSLPKVDANIIHGAKPRWRALARQLQHVTQTVTSENELDGAISILQNDLYLINPSTGGALQIEDSPGNFTYEWVNESLVITVYGPDGAPLYISKPEGTPRFH